MTSRTWGDNAAGISVSVVCCSTSGSEACTTSRCDVESGGRPVAAVLRFLYLRRIKSLLQFSRSQQSCFPRKNNICFVNVNLSSNSTCICSHFIFTHRLLTDLQQCSNRSTSTGNLLSSQNHQAKKKKKAFGRDKVKTYSIVSCFR